MQITFMADYSQGLEGCFHLIIDKINTPYLTWQEAKRFNTNLQLIATDLFTQSIKRVI